MKKIKHPMDLDSPYWICKQCAETRGGKYAKTASTASSLTCQYCDGAHQTEDYIFPVIDYKWKRKAKK